MHRRDIIRDYLATLIRETGYCPTYAPSDVVETPCGAVYRRPAVAVTYRPSTLSTPRAGLLWRPRKVRLTRQARELVAMVRDMVSRERVAMEDLAQAAREARKGNTDRTAAARERARMDIVGYVNVTEQWDPSTWKGLTTSREARYAERGRGTAAKVSVRDAHVAPLLLRGLKTVGVATHPDATDADYVMLVNTVRANPTWATLTRRMPGPHGYSTLLDTVVPVSHYTDKAREQGEPQGVRHVQAQAAPRESDSVRLASVIGYVGNVE